ncbi:FecR family protein [Chitinophaga nivalis]|uniref:FecR domain-containing protein n=2 Tax=Chitinophaga nivalis TaxID=2991709 RepID=A0ABT3IN98_9BACT|nr:FecR domain-containing protein [Chitinophaga nivalis]MCW3485442.1 FecR domain-containing protein [Chitinophaga nivalis]
MAKKLAGEAAVAELQELEQLLRANPDLHFPATVLAAYWKKSVDPAAKSIAETAHEKHILRMQQQGIPIGLPAAEVAEATPAVRIPTYRRYMIAATIAGMVMAACWWMIAGRGPAERSDTYEVATRNGTRTQLQLPDGTRVWLNAGSKLTYGHAFGQVNREVTLIGEAFFDVTKNAEQPFIIHTAKMDVKVLGTQFNVKAYPNEPTTEATLIQGSIEASLKDRPREAIRLKPHEKVLIRNNPEASLPAEDTSTPALFIQTLSHYNNNADAIVETSWMENKLVFREESFAALAKRMERRYGVTIRFEDPATAALQFTGIFEKETVQQALNALQLIAAFDYTIEGTQIIINQ